MEDRSAGSCRQASSLLFPISFFISGLLLLTFLPPVQDALRGDEGKNLLRTNLTSSVDAPRTRININRIGSWYGADGTEEFNSHTGNWGLSYPKGTTGAIFTSGLLWTGLHNDGQGPAIRTNGHMYNTGMQTGAILGTQTGQIEDESLPDVRIWRVRRDFATADLTEDAADLNQVSVDHISPEQVDSVRQQYETDWLEWPAHKGAPFYDSDRDGNYEPMIVEGVPVPYPEADEPGLGGADQVIWYVANDLKGSPFGRTISGLEIQETVWAYDRTDGLGDAVFKRYRLIYKGIAGTPDSARIDQMYVGIFSDPDLGTFANDFVGCDSLLGLSYCYNADPVDAQYEDFGLPPPAIGYEWLQGPIVEGVSGEDRNRNGIDDGIDNGIVDLRRTGRGLINLPLRSMLFGSCHGLGCWPVDAPFNYSGALQLNCVLQGLPGNPQPPPCPLPGPDPWTGNPAPLFWVYGDPLTGTGWIDGIIDSPGDRRIVFATGPVSMMLDDTIEIAVAVVGGLGSDNLNSITRLKGNAKLARLAYDSLFVLPGAPAQPTLRAVGLDRQVFLDWDSDQGRVRSIEDSLISGGYWFEGYKVYQFPDSMSQMAEGKLIGQFDLVNGITSISQLIPDPVTGELFVANVQYGTDNGIVRTLAINIDSLRGGEPLANGRYYYFGVTAYNYTDDPILQVRSYESAPLIVQVQPETPKPGDRLAYGIGDTVATISQRVGISDVRINPVIYDPLKQQGEQYTVRFDSLIDGSLIWNLLAPGGLPILDSVMLADSTAQRVHQSGFDLTVLPPPNGVVGVTNQDAHPVFGSTVVSDDGTLGGLLGSAETAVDYEIVFGRESFAMSVESPTFLSKAIRVPFSVVERGRGSSDTDSVQVVAVVRDSGNTGSTWNRTPAGHMIGDTLYPVFEPIYLTNFRYVPDNPSTPFREDSFAVAINRSALASMTMAHPGSSPSELAAYALFVVDAEGDSIPPSSGSLYIHKYHEVRAGDELVITLDRSISGDVTLARGDVTLINVFPNPYYGLNIDERSLGERFVTFNHLPARASIRIFNLAGIQVIRLVKDDPGTQYLRWNLSNANNNVVGSGIYLIHMELQDQHGVDLGTRFLKLAVIQEERP